jgi:hypothetical protein
MFDLETLAVAEPDAMAKKPEKEEPQTLFAVKGYPSWFEWLKAAADHEGLPVMNFIDLAVKDRAKRNGFDQPMPRRVGRSK